jgi:hypothetical protein
LHAFFVSLQEKLSAEVPVKNGCPCLEISTPLKSGKTSVLKISPEILHKNFCATQQKDAAFQDAFNDIRLISRSSVYQKLQQKHYAGPCQEIQQRGPSDLRGNTTFPILACFSQVRAQN